MITRETKVLFYNTEKEAYEIERLGNRNANRVPVCTIAHFFNTVCELFEDITPKIVSNPMYQNINWETAIENEVPEVKV